MMLIDTTTFITLVITAIFIFAATVTAIICCNESRSKRESDKRTDKLHIDLGEAKIILANKERILEAIYFAPARSEYGMQWRKDLSAYLVFRQVYLEYDWAYRYIPIKAFGYNPEDEEDKDFARREAEELLEKLRED